MNIANYSLWNNPEITDEQWEVMLDETNDLILQINQIEGERINSIIGKAHDEQYQQLFRVIDEYYRLEELEVKRQKEHLKKYLENLGMKQMLETLTYIEMEKKWKENFLKSISDKQLKSCPIDEYLWNVFTYDIIIDYKIGEKAKQEFNNHAKGNVYIFEEHGSDVYHVYLPENITSSMFRLLYGMDIYIVDENFKWTYIFKHENCNEPIWYSI